MKQPPYAKMCIAQNMDSNAIMALVWVAKLHAIKRKSVSIIPTNLRVYVSRRSSASMFYFI